MAKTQGETERQYMDRLREARGLPPQTRENLLNPDTMMARSRAAVGYINGGTHSTAQQERLKVSAFMSIFHPEVPDTEVRQMMRDAGAAADRYL